MNLKNQKSGSAAATLFSGPTHPIGRKLILLALTALLISPAALRASTSITSPTVSGHWSLSGSPYLIFNNVQVPASASLTIDPGVSVIFQGSYNMDVSGMLYASGSAAQPINMSVADTTGWWNDATPTGGWLGITFDFYSGTSPDTSILKYCNIRNVKIDSVDALAGQFRALKINRHLKMLNCQFTNNKGSYTNLILANTEAAGDVLEIGSCTFTNNVFLREVCAISNYNGGSTYIHDNQINHNTGLNIFSGTGVNILFQYNELDSNTSQNGTLMLAPAYSTLSKDSKGSITDNKIHHNTNTSDGSIWCLSGFLDIRNNLICNNQHISGVCGAVDGGGGINIGHNASTPMDSTLYTLRNNIIANNFSPFHGGAISIYHARSVISNNQIVNNQATTGGAIYMLDTMPLVCKNNLFYGNITTGNTVYNSAVMNGLATASVEFTHNWKQHASLLDLNGIMGGYTLTGDTTTNVTGTNPGMVMPTLTPGTAENAVTANMDLLATSICIDRGDTAHAMSFTTDYLHNARISGSAIDIGAYEYPAGDILSTPAGPNTVSAPGISVFPNPAVNMVYVATPEAEGSIYISDASGRIVAGYKVSSNLTFVDLHNLTKGIYIAVYTDANGGQSQQKFIVE